VHIIFQIILDITHINTTFNVMMTNHLQIKRRLFYLKTQSVPRSKHFSSRL